MDTNVKVYRVDGSIDSGRPMIDHDDPINVAIDWSVIGDVLDGIRDIKDYSPVEFTVEDMSATEWDYYVSAGTLGVFSHRAIKLIGTMCFRHFDLLPVRLNGAAYTFLRCKNRMACFDVARAEVRRFDCKPHRIMEVLKYAFDKTMLLDPLCFCVPELLVELFVTESVRQCALKHKLKGFEFTLVD